MSAISEVDFTELRAFLLTKEKFNMLHCNGEPIFELLLGIDPHNQNIGEGGIGNDFRCFIFGELLCVAIEFRTYNLGKGCNVGKIMHSDHIFDGDYVVVDLVPFRGC